MISHCVIDSNVHYMINMISHCVIDSNVHYMIGMRVIKGFI